MLQLERANLKPGVFLTDGEDGESSEIALGGHNMDTLLNFNSEAACKLFAFALHPGTWGKRDMCFWDRLGLLWALGTII